MKKNKEFYIYLSILIILPIVFYFRSLSQYFIAEDFIQIRYSSQGFGWWRIKTFFTSPCLGVSQLGYYRPVFETIFSFLYIFIKTSPFWYHFIGLILHLLNTILVFLIANMVIGGGRSRPGFIAALFFTLHPFTPNVLIFQGGHFTSLSGFFIAAAFYLYLLYRRDALQRYLLISIGCYILALGVYEASVILPLLLIVYDLIGSRVSSAPLRKNNFKAYIPYLAISAGYFLVRKLVIGSFVKGGLIETRDIIYLILSLPVLFKHLIAYTGGIFFPLDRLPDWLLPIFASVMLLFYCSTFLLKRMRLFFLLTFCMCWIFFAGLPLGLPVLFSGIMSRYAYFASAGFCIALAGLVTIVFSESKKIWIKPAILILLSIYALFYAILLKRNIDVYILAGKTTHSIQEQFSLFQDKLLNKRAVFFVDYPIALLRRGFPAAPVFNWGLNDALRQPFSENKVPVFPMKSPFTGRVISEETLLSLTNENRDIYFVKWNQKTGKVEKVPIESNLNKPTVPFIKTLYPAEGERVLADPERTMVIFDGSIYNKFTLFIFSEGMLIADSFNREGAAGKLSPNEPLVRAMPVSLLKDGLRLYSGRFFWLIEARDEENRVVARSPLMSFELVFDLIKETKCF